MQHGIMGQRRAWEASVPSLTHFFRLWTGNPQSYTETGVQSFFYSGNIVERYSTQPPGEVVLYAWAQGALMSPNGIQDNEYRALAEFRYQIRRFLRFSERAARNAGLEPQQHQMLLAVKGLPNGTRATVGELAERLQIQHHSTVELVDRLVKRGLVLRKRTGEDRREVLIQLTAKGEKILRELSVHHRDELKTAGPALVGSLKKMMSAAQRAGKQASVGRKAARKE